MSESAEIKSVPPKPPPPPPSGLPLQTLKQSPKTLAINEPPQLTENDLDLTLKIILSHEADFSRVFFIRNTYLEPQLQDGPKCGLVALSIATSKSGNFVSVDAIFQTALSLGLTKQGEMFSADSLALLAEKRCGFKTTVIKGGLNTHLKCIIESLMRNRLLLVPYDADFNHSPCCKRGLKAHWAVISGFVIIEECKTELDSHSVVLTSSNCSVLCDCSDSDTDLIVSTDGGRIFISKRTDDDKNKNDFGMGKLYLIGRQGKSRHFGLWSFDKMADSNENLVSVSADRSPELYLLPKNGLSEGLKGKAIILDRPMESHEQNTERVLLVRY